MDDLFDVFKIFKLFTRLKNFGELSLWQKIMAIFGVLGLLLTIVFFFWSPSEVEVEEFKLGPAHQVAYEACSEAGADADYFGDVTVPASCGCLARHWAHDFSSDHQTDIKAGLDYMFDYYDKVDWANETDYEQVDRLLVNKYAQMAGKLNMPTRPVDVMRSQMSTLTAATEVCMDSWALSGSAVTEIAALTVYGESALDVPHNEADVVMALRGPSDATILSVSN